MGMDMETLATAMVMAKGMSKGGGGGGGSSDVMRVISTYDADAQTYTLGSTWQEIKDACDAGKIVFTFCDLSSSEDAPYYSMSTIASIDASEVDTDSYLYTVRDATGEYTTVSADGYPVFEDGK